MQPAVKSNFSPFEFVAFALLALLMMIIPFPKGGMVDWVAPALIGVGVLLFLSMSLHKLFYTQIDIKLEMIWFAPILVTLVWVGLQLFVFPQLFGWYALFDDEEIKGTFFEDFVSPIDLITSIQWMGYFFTYWCVAWVASNLSKRYVKLLLWMIVIISMVVASYALIAFLGKHNTILGIWEKVDNIRFATGSFVNRNHFANFIVICLPVALSLLVERDFDSIKSKLALPLIVLYLIVVISAVISSQSRMGGILLLIAIIVWFACYLARVREQTFTQEGVLLKRVILGCCAAFVIVWMFWFGFNETFERFFSLGLGEARSEFRYTMYSMPTMAWLLGIQPGVFSDVYSYYAPVDINFRLSHAHNDFLEFALEFGVIGSVLLLLALVPLVLKIANHSKSIVYNAVLVVSVVMFFHSLVDFSLHIPANAVYFWSIIGLGANVSLTSTLFVSDQLTQRVSMSNKKAIDIPDVVDENRVSLSAVSKKEGS